MLAKFPIPPRFLWVLVSEELRRLDSDEVYAEALAELKKGLGEPTKGRRTVRPAATSKVAIPPAATKSTKTAARKPPKSARPARKKATK